MLRPYRRADGDSTRRRDHERCHRPHGAEPASRAVHPRHPGAGRGAAARRRPACPGPDPGRSQRGETAGHRGRPRSDARLDGFGRLSCEPGGRDLLRRHADEPPSWPRGSRDCGGEARLLREARGGQHKGWARARAVGHPSRPEAPGRPGQTFPSRPPPAHAAYATFALDGPTGEILAQFNSSWAVRVYRDDLLQIQVDGTLGSAVATLRGCKIQGRAQTPRAVWNPDVPNAADFYASWQDVP